MIPGLVVSAAMLNAPAPLSGDLPFRVSVCWLRQNFGAGVGVCEAVQVAAATAAAAATWVLWRDAKGAPADRMALTVFLSLLATRYGYTDDMVAWSVALAALAHALGWRIDLLDSLFWLWPALCPVVFMKTGLLVTPVVVVLAAFRTWRRAGMVVPLLPRRPSVLPRAG